MLRILKLARTYGIAGQYTYDVTVEYPGESPHRVAFVGNSYGGPIVMVTDGGAQVVVTAPERFGNVLDAAWVRAFFGNPGAAL